MELPAWIKEIGPNKFEVDPEVFYPEILGELGVDPDDASQYWMEIAQGCMKLDFDMAVRVAKKIDREKTVERRIVAVDASVKDRWCIANHPVGHKNWNTMTIQERGQDVRDNWKRIRGLE